MLLRRNPSRWRDPSISFRRRSSPNSERGESRARRELYRCLEMGPRRDGCWVSMGRCGDLSIRRVGMLLGSVRSNPSRHGLEVMEKTNDLTTKLHLSGGEDEKPGLGGKRAGRGGGANSSVEGSFPPEYNGRRTSMGVSMTRQDDPPRNTLSSERSRPPSRPRAEASLVRHADASSYPQSAPPSSSRSISGRAAIARGASEATDDAATDRARWRHHPPPRGVASPAVAPAECSTLVASARAARCANDPATERWTMRARSDAAEYFGEDRADRP
mmetsp:Transcript_7954/g.23572  ORF Transcript_7954/g.23572 Transcript_7954/m.23572 type:complete len:273 (-) Transcript_7954:266-1084(-)